MRTLIITITLAILVACGTKKKQETKAPLTQQDRVVDRANLMTESEEDSLFTLIQDLEMSVGSQIAVLTIDTLNGEKLEEFSLRTAEEMRLGRSKYSDGVLITFSLRDGKMRMEVGYGLENILKDEVTMRISRDIIAPMFREEKYGKGFFLGVKKIKDLIEENKDLVGQR